MCSIKIQTLGCTSILFFYRKKKVLWQMSLGSVVISQKRAIW
uniref:Uncharacterized protein n=1 Tax=Rhizophora mucronata TaxID=61149 RepID=A0A2P2N0H8_RHIMU